MILSVLDAYYTKYTLAHKNLCEKSDWIMNHQYQSFDFAFIGNSRVINMIDVNVVEKKTGKSGINLGLVGANNAESYIILNRFLNSGNSIKNLIIQVDMHSLDSKTLPYPFHSYNYMHLLSDSIVSNTFKDNVSITKWLMWKYIPFARYMEFSNKYVLYKIVKGGYECKVNEKFDTSKGSDIENNKVLKPEKYEYKYSIVEKTDKKYFDKLIQLANQKGMNVILYTAPMYHQYFDHQLKLKDILNEIGKEAKEQHIPYVNFSGTMDSLCTDTKNYNDNIHMNDIGVYKFSLAIADSLKQVLK